MTLDEMRKALDGLWIPHDQWGSGGGQTIHAPLLEKQKEHLRRIRALLERQVEVDKKTLSDLHATIQRIKHGGGM